MKRGDSNKDFPKESDSPLHFRNKQNNNHHQPSTMSPNNLIYQKSNGITARGADSNRNIMDSLESNDRCEPKSSWLEQGQTPDGGVYVQEEIHPGVMLEGYAIEI